MVAATPSVIPGLIRSSTPRMQNITARLLARFMTGKIVPLTTWDTFVRMPAIILLLVRVT